MLFTLTCGNWIHDISCDSLKTCVVLCCFVLFLSAVNPAVQLCAYLSCFLSHCGLQHHASCGGGGDDTKHCSINPTAMSVVHHTSPPCLWFSSLEQRTREHHNLSIFSISNKNCLFVDLSSNQVVFFSFETFCFLFLPCRSFPF